MLCIDVYVIYIYIYIYMCYILVALYLYIYSIYVYIYIYIERERERCFVGVCLALKISQHVIPLVCGLAIRNRHRLNWDLA